MRIHSERVTNILRKIGINDDKGYAVAIFLALIIIASVVAGYYLWLKPPSEPYSTIYLLDTQQEAVDYPVTLVANQNSTFNVWVGVVNHMGGNVNQSFQVLVKITPNLSDFPVATEPIQTYNISLPDGNTPWQTLATISQNQVGNYSVVFELWLKNHDGVYEFTHNFAVLNIQVIS